jgi:hypothetical protein
MALSKVLLFLFLVLYMPRHRAKMGSSFREHIVQSEDCSYNNRIILNLETSGLSNRLYALVSVSMLAAVTNRVLEVDWQLDKGIRVPFHELFDAIRSKWGTQTYMTLAFMIPQ